MVVTTRIEPDLVSNEAVESKSYEEELLATLELEGGGLLALLGRRGGGLTCVVGTERIRRREESTRYWGREEGYRCAVRDMERMEPARANGMGGARPDLLHARRI
jgi:hypothetical protein